MITCTYLTFSRLVPVSKLEYLSLIKAAEVYNAKKIYKSGDEHAAIFSTNHISYLYIFIFPQFFAHIVS